MRSVAARVIQHTDRGATYAKQLPRKAKSLHIGQILEQNRHFRPTIPTRHSTLVVPFQMRTNPRLAVDKFAYLCYMCMIIKLVAMIFVIREKWIQIPTDQKIVLFCTAPWNTRAITCVSKFCFANPMHCVFASFLLLFMFFYLLRFCAYNVF